MKKLRKLTRTQKRFLEDQGFVAEDYLFERKDAWNYVFYNIHTKQLVEMRY